jgi:hypothetical protein
MPHAKRLTNTCLPRRFPATLLALVLALPLAAFAQTNPFATLPNSNQNNAQPNTQNSQQAATSTTPQTVSGTVVDATTGQAIFRVLVKLSAGSVQRALLTDSEGHFSFAGVSSGAANITLTKPGYSVSPYTTDSASTAIGANSLGTPIKLTLYPEALLKGTVSGPDGNPIANLNLRAIRITVDDSGRHALVNGFAHTNDQGKFRMTLAAGEYRIQTDYLPPRDTSTKPSTNESYAVMPLVFPEGSSQTDSTIRVQPGEQRDLDLHPTLAPMVSVLIHSPSFHDFSGLSAIAGNGASFTLSLSPANSFRSGRGNGPSSSSDFEAQMPAGSYTLRARSRGFGGLFSGGQPDDSIEQASVTVSPSQHPPVSLTLQFLPISAVPIEFSYEDPAQATQSTTAFGGATQNPRSLGVALEPMQPDPSITDEFLHPRQRNGADFSFLAPPGSYRLRANGFNGSYIASATYGGNDVLSHPLLIAAGAGGSALRIVISNQTAALKGKVTIASAPAQAYLYFIATNPSASPLHIVRSGSDGNYAISALPPGDYRVLALAGKRPIDPNYPASYDAYTSQIGSISLKAGDSLSLDLQAVPESELRP